MVNFIEKKLIVFSFSFDNVINSSNKMQAVLFLVVIRKSVLLELALILPNSSNDHQGSSSDFILNESS